jgi:hypothetical protein
MPRHVPHPKNGRFRPGEQRQGFGFIFLAKNRPFLMEFSLLFSLHHESCAQLSWSKESRMGLLVFKQTLLQFSSGGSQVSLLPLLFIHFGNRDFSLKSHLFSMKI